MAPKITPYRIATISERASEFYRSGRPNEAVSILAPVMPFAGKISGTQAIYGKSLSSLGQHENSVPYLRRAVKLEPSDHELRIEFSLALKLAGEFDNALEQVKRARESGRWHPKAVFVEAELLMDSGLYQNATELLDAFESNADEKFRTPYNMAQLCTTRTRLVPNFIAAESVLDDAYAYADHMDVPTRQRAMLWFSISVMLDKVGKFDDAMAAIVRSKELNATRWNAKEHTERTRACIDAWTSASAGELPTARVDGSGIVFILGMPRSGSSLLEQMLSCHTDVVGLGERNEVISAADAIHTSKPWLLPMVTNLNQLTPKFCQQLAMQMADSYNSQRRGGVKYVIDKQPFNFVNVPLLARLLPGCRVLHTIRDPRDTAMSYFMQWFVGSHGQSNSLDSIGKYYRDYRQMMDAWSTLDAPKHCPELLDVHYESLVAEPENTIRGALDFLGLDFDPGVLNHTRSERVVPTASRDQVRSELYKSSIQRWKRYENYIAPIEQHAGKYIPKGG
jgi:tetratricopeptide (TPR) repeat protein